MKRSNVLLSIFLYIFHVSHAIEVIVDPKNHSYRIDSKHETVLSGSNIAVFVAGKWCVHGSTEGEESLWPMELQQRKNTNGVDSVLGYFSGVTLEWNCILEDNIVIPLETSFRNFKNGTAVIFDLKFPNGATNTSFADPETSMTNFPAFLLPTKYSYLSWHGSFIQSTRGMSKGPQGGPTVFFKPSSDDDDSIDAIVGAPWIDFETMKSFTAGTNKDFKGQPAWAPGTSARIQEIPIGYTQSFILYEGTGITATLHEWGQAMQRKPKLEDVTLTNIGYQTDNGAAYCFCKDTNCSATVSDGYWQLDYLPFANISLLSFY